MFRPSVATFSTRVQKVTQHIGANSAASQAASIKGTESEKMNEVQVPNVKKRIKGKIPSPAKTDDLNGKQARKTVKVEEMTIPGKSLAKSDDYVAFEVYGEPIALQRHRVLRSGISYNPSSKQQKQFLDSSTPFLPSVPFEGPLEMRVAFYFKRPLNHYGSGKNSHVLKPGMEIWHSKRKGALISIQA